MKGYFRKRGNKWSFTLDVGSDPASGKRKQRTASGFKTKKDAEKACAEMITEIENGQYVPPSKSTVGQFMLDYLESSLKGQVAPNTYEGRLAYVKNHIVPNIGNVKLTELTPMDVQKFYNKLREKYGAGHVQNIGNLLSKAFTQAVKWGMIQKNVITLVKKPPTSRRNASMKVWTVDQQKMFLAYAEKGPLGYFVLFLLALTSGMRKGELLGITWGDINMKDGLVHVKRTVVYAENKLDLKDMPKTESSIRTIQIPEHTIKALRLYKLSQKPNELNLVFPSPKTNGLLYPNSLDKQFLKTAAEAGVPRISFHGLRHTFATTLLGTNVNAKIVQEMLGHATIKTTMDTYSHVLPIMQKEAAKHLNAVLF